MATTLCVHEWLGVPCAEQFYLPNPCPGCGVNELERLKKKFVMFQNCHKHDGLFHIKMPSYPKLSASTFERLQVKLNTHQGIIFNQVPTGVVQLLEYRPIKYHNYDVTALKFTYKNYQTETGKTNLILWTLDLGLRIQPVIKGKSSDLCLVAQYNK